MTTTTENRPYEVDASTLKEWLENEEAVLVDVREFVEHTASRLSSIILSKRAMLTNPAMVRWNQVLGSPDRTRTYGTAVNNRLGRPSCLNAGDLRI